MNSNLSPVDVLVFVLPGVVDTALILLASVGLGFLLAIVAGLGTMSRQWLVRAVFVVYVEVFRGTSFLVQLFYFYYVLPLLGVSLSPFLVGVLALGLNAGSYGAEITRGAFSAIPQSQRDAIVALNIRPQRALCAILLPQAASRMVLPMGNLLIEMVKSTPLLALVSIGDLLYRGQMLIATSGQTTLIYSLLLLIYIGFGMPLSHGIRSLDRHLSRYRGDVRV